MRVRIEIECDNAAFGGGRTLEVERILRELCYQMREAGRVQYVRELDGKKLRDINGNTVGTVTIEE